MAHQFVGVSGLPRAGSTLLCQLLSEHPDIHCDGHSSPLCNSLLGMRRSISDEPYLLSRLDVQFDTTYAQLQSAMQGFLNGWYAQNDRAVVADKNRAWLHCIEFLLQLEPTAKVLVSVRELGQIYGSIEAQHQKTILLDFVDHLADFDRFGRADQLFAKEKSIGAPLSSILAVQDLPQAIRDRLYFVKFEDLVAQPQQTMSQVYSWLGVQPHALDTANLSLRPHESDSHYRYKYRHRQHASITPPQVHEVPPRIQALVRKAFGWYYDWLYPHLT